MLNLSGRLRGIFLRLAVLSSFCSDVSKSVEILTEKGQDYFDRTYGETAATVQPFLREICPDFGQ